MAEAVNERIILASAVRGARTIVAPFQVQILQGDQLVIAYAGASALNSGSGLQVSFRQLGPSGEVTSSRYVVSLTTDYLVRRHTIAMSEGFLLSMSVHPLFTALQGQFWCQASITRTSGAEDLYLMPLLQGYPTISQVVSWPGSPLMAQGDGQWYPRSVPVSANTGVAWAEIVPTGAQWQVVAIRFNLQTDATAGDRTVQIDFRDFASGGKASTMQGPAQPPSTTRLYSFGRGQAHASAFSGTTWVDALPDDMILIGGDRVGPDITNLAAGDQWLVPRLNVLERLSFV